MYNKLIADVSQLIQETENIKVAHEKVTPIKNKLVKELKQYQGNFKKNATKAQELVEWDKYTIAFFGETNAGKSTIIESLRILGNEKSKIKEHQEIKKLQDSIQENTNKTTNLENKSAVLNQEINVFKEKKIIINASIDKINKENQEISDEKLKEITRFSKFEEIIYILKNQLIEAEKSLSLVNKKIKDSEGEISKEEKRIYKKQHSYFFKFNVWIGNVFNKKITINEEKLIQLKNEKIQLKENLEIEIINLKTLNNKKINANLNLNNSNENIQKFENKLKELKTSVFNLKENDNEYHRKITSKSNIIKEFLKEIKEFQQIIITKKKELNPLGDGKIIGTGKQDFTVEVNSYELEYNGKTVVLIDVPGIEGNEAKYTEMIKNAVTKAHAIFYVNGSSKKPEEKTLTKIKSYLQDQTTVYSIANVKGKADSYEFDEERISLEKTHKNLEKTVQLTKEILQNTLGNSYAGHINIQGLIAFTASSEFICSQRNDLVRSAKNFRNYFDSSESMLDFSNINSITSLIKQQQPHFKDKIKIANHQTIIGISTRFADDLKKFQEKIIPDDTINQLKREIKGYKNEVEINIIGLENTFDNLSRRLANQFYSELQTFIHYIIDKEFYKLRPLFSNPTTEITGLISYLEIDNKNEEKLNRLIHLFSEQLSRKIQGNFKQIIEKELKSFFQNLQNKKQRITTRLKSLNNAGNYSHNNDNHLLNLDSLTEGVDFGTFLKEGFNIVTTIGGMATAGFALGSFVPVIGNIIGVIIVAVLGVVFYAIKSFFGGESAEAKLKRKLEPQLVESKKQFRKHFSGISKTSISNIKANTNEENKLLDLCITGIKDLQEMLINKNIDIKLLIQDLEIQKQNIITKIKSNE
ncbi:hypothetical protein G1K52_05170 [Tenacibaculum finnmarkense]|uniref:GTPase n=1 Tax=Tenacibaculum finnmarkense TaxID=2781243 RepID=UPI001EFAD1A0|nr:GTPase [Tenacibaculum finnmarkense]MCG8785153.1 hypothetical protein [Tenacibaculum finnmarkense]